MKINSYGHISYYRDLRFWEVIICKVCFCYICARIVGLDKYDVFNEKHKIQVMYHTTPHKKEKGATYYKNEFGCVRIEIWSNYNKTFEINY